MSDMKSRAEIDNNQHIRQSVLKLLDEIQATYSIRIIFACEGGSRGWGTQNGESDCDVRGLYIMDEDKYLGVSKGIGVISNFSMQLQGTSLLIDYIFQDFRKFLKRNILNQKNQLNLILHSKDPYVNLLTAQSLSYLKENLPIPIRGINGHLMELYKEVMNVKQIQPKKAINCIVFGLQMIHIMCFTSYPLYSCVDQVQFMREWMQTQREQPISDEISLRILQQLDAFQIDKITSLFQILLSMKRENIDFITEEQSQVIKEFMQKLSETKIERFSKPLSMNQLNLQFQSVLKQLKPS